MKLPHLLALALLLGGAGCLSTNGLHTARTVPRGGYEVHAVPQAHLSNDAAGLQGGGGSAVGVRVGVLDDLDIGVVASVAQLRVEGRVRLFDSEHLDLAIAPAGYLASVTVSSQLVPVAGAGALGILTWSPSRDLSINLVGGAEAAVLTDDGSVGFLSRQGFGVRWWVSDTFALHPEVISVSDIERELDLVDLSAGIGFVFAPGRS